MVLNFIFICYPQHKVQFDVQKLHISQIFCSVYLIGSGSKCEKDVNCNMICIHKIFSFQSYIPATATPQTYFAFKHSFSISAYRRFETQWKIKRRMRIKNIDSVDTSVISKARSVDFLKTFFLLSYLSYSIIFCFHLFPIYLLI